VWEVHTGAVSATTGSVLLATLLGLAIVEHVLMAFPLSIERLWGWAMGQSSSPQRPMEAGRMPLPPLRAAAKPDRP
jgi:hypothetical protein